MRARSFKPGFFKNELLAKMPPLVRLTFAGLWLLSDRDGRMEDRPAKIKAELFPYGDEIDMDAALTTLAEGDDPFISRYSVNGHKFIEITKFPKHQNPHVRESASTIPAPSKAGARTVRGTRPKPPDSLTPPSLTPDSPFSDCLTAAIPPTEESVLAYWKERGLSGNPNEFMDHFRSNGWKVGRGNAPMKDWTAAARNWSAREAKRHRLDRPSNVIHREGRYDNIKSEIVEVKP